MSDERAAAPTAGGTSGGTGWPVLGGRRGRAVELGVVTGLLLLAAVVWWVSGARSNYDTALHVVWGRELLAGQRPGFEAYAASTPHPLWLGVGAVLVAVVTDGAAADRAAALLCAVALVLLAWGGWRLTVVLLAPRGPRPGAEEAGPAGAHPGPSTVDPAGAGARRLRAARAAGVIALLLLLSSFALLLLAARAYLDVPFLALVVWAAVRAAERPAAWRTPALLLLAAGLLRPEAWLLAGLHWLWTTWVLARAGRPAGRPAHGVAPARATRRIGSALRRLAARPAHLGVVLLAPGLWVLVDLLVTGNPLHSLTATSSLAAELGRVRGLDRAPAVLVRELTDQARPPVALGGVVGLVLIVAAGRLGLPRPDGPRLALLLALLGAGVATFLLAGVAGLSLLPRYLTVPVVALTVLAAWGATGWLALPAGHRARRPWAALVAVGALLGVGGYVVLKRTSFSALAGELAFLADTRRDLRTVLDDRRVRAGLRCGPLTLPTYRLVPEARLLLDAPRSGVLARSAPGVAASGSPARRGGVALVVDGDARARERLGEAAGVSRRFAGAPPGYIRWFGVGPFVVHARCPAR